VREIRNTKFNSLIQILLGVFWVLGVWGFVGFIEGNYSSNESKVKEIVVSRPVTRSSKESKSNNLQSFPQAKPSAICRDGTYSYSSNRRGTCSHHGGVARWL
jgi:hypothetical protein